MSQSIERDKVRGVSKFHSRVTPADESDMDTLAQKRVHVPWNQEFYDDPPDPLYRVVAFLHRLANIGTTDREIFFARLTNMSWADIGAVFLRGATAQAAEKRFADTVERFPELGLAFPESKRNKTKGDKT
jgi:hypothetical protein